MTESADSVYNVNKVQELSLDTSTLCISMEVTLCIYVNIQ